MNVFLDAKEESVRILMEDISASAQKEKLKLTECVRNQLQECHTELLYRTSKKQSTSTSLPSASAIAGTLMLAAMLRSSQSGTSPLINAAAKVRAASGELKASALLVTTLLRRT